MPPSQLKQLKSSLRESGVIGPQQSKKQKRQDAKTGAGVQNRNQRNAALQAIRDRFNPFEIKASTKKVKFDYTSRDGGAAAAKNTARPGVTKSVGEERRRATLLREMDRKNKVGGIVDRRFGENDPTMTPEERAAERYARESQKKLRKESMFNLEEDEEDELQLTHMGQSLTFDDAPKDDFEDGDVQGLEEEEQSDSETPRKRKRVFLDGEEKEEGEDGMGSEGEEEPGRKKSKHEVMKEVIAKSKFHKAERQQMREDDADLRDELDQGLPDLFDMLRGAKPRPKAEEPQDDMASVNPERAALMESKDPGKEYDQRLKQLTFDKRSQPTDRTKTAEEKIAEEAERLKKLEEDRVRRMRGEQASDDESASESESEGHEGSDSDESIPDDAKAFGLQQPTQSTTRPEQGADDEDDFIIDDDLVETRSDVSLSIGESASEEGSSDSEEEEEEEDEGEDQDELINGLTIPNGGATSTDSNDDDKLAFTYPCPTDHASFLATIKDVPVDDIPTVVQRIRALHHPRLHSDNKRNLGLFAEVLIQHVSYMVESAGSEVPFAIVEILLRHIHSLAKSHPSNVSMAFRARLRLMETERPLALTPSDLVILTAVGAIFPTSDHFHAIATPAQLCLARYLGQGALETLTDLATGAYACTLVLQYQVTSKRFMPEFVNYVLNAVCILGPVQSQSKKEGFPIRQPERAMHMQATSTSSSCPRKLRFRDVVATPTNPGDEEDLKASLLSTFVTLLDTAADLWTDQCAYEEIFRPAETVLRSLVQGPGQVQALATGTLSKITTHMDASHQARRPLYLHAHRPLAIKTAIPKFEESFNPAKHYDPDRERAESSRLRSEFKRERKGAMRELRKDANFVAREQLRSRKERDAAYEKKYKRLVADVQNEEGRAANEYERVKRLRRGQV